MIIEAKGSQDNIIGRLGENEARKIEFKVGKILREFPDAVFTVLHKRPGDENAYPVSPGNLTLEDNSLYWEIKSGDLENVGIGYCEVCAYQDSAIVKSLIFRTKIEPALDNSGEVPEPWESWVGEVVEAANDAIEAKEAAETAQEKAETAEANAESSATSASGSARTATSAKEDAVTAKTAAQAARDAAQAAMLRYPYVDPVTGDWMVWNASTSAFVDTGVHAQGPTGTVPDIEVGTVTTVEHDVPADVVRRAGSPDEAPIFDFWLPKGETGVPENLYATTIPMSSSDSTKISEAMAGKVDKENGKGLSENDFTDTLKTKLDGIEAGAEVNPGNATTSADGLMSATDKGKLDGIESGAQVNPGNATTSEAGLMSATDKTKLNGIATGATANVVSNSLSDTSTTNALSAAKGKELADQINALFTQGVKLFEGQISVGSNITLNQNINNYRLYAIMDANADNESTQDINPLYGDASSFPALIASVVDYSSGADVMVLSDIALVSSDGIHYTCVRSAQVNLNSTGVAHYSNNQARTITIWAYV